MITAARYLLFIVYSKSMIALITKSVFKKKTSSQSGWYIQRSNFSSNELWSRKRSACIVRYRSLKRHIPFIRSVRQSPMISDSLRTCTSRLKKNRAYLFDTILEVDYQTTFITKLWFVLWITCYFMVLCVQQVFFCARNSWIFSLTHFCGK